ncbi:MAG: hypothetical protein DWQ34_14995 [Planctomycetota bacterium]|nr:MAG: hypothetical protein DWQ29_14155 [Planctomycetota bacterium]REJ91463.1 MAG: hypothetical protein DWQ34_14995 [Planctomycetota bacterium]REK25573.1 MAG: hypothetical protein DWQ41_11575 [Planctomycetota bacterium]REK31715.1 MAG: hypothetical protein DWQ45_19110 [Planctomycetota bacterium]
MTARLPDEVTPGEHRVIVLIDGEHEKIETATDKPQLADVDEASSEDCLEWKEGLLVYTGKLECDPMQVLRQIREAREHRLVYGPFE